MDWSSDPTALERGWPIATGVMEGACRHLVKDRMDITGARWELDGAEAVLKLPNTHQQRRVRRVQALPPEPPTLPHSRCPLCQRHDPEGGVMCL